MNEQRRSVRPDRAQRRFRDLIQQLDAIVWEADPATWQFTFVSRRAEQILGYPIERWLAERAFWIALIHSDDREQAIARCRAAIEAGLDHDFEFRALAADGRVLWLHNIVYVVRDSDGTARKLRGVMIDITARKAAEEALRVRVRQQAAVADLGQRALAGTGLAALMDDAVAVVARTLDVEYSKVLELLPEGDRLLLRAGTGWPPGVVGHFTVGTGRESQAGYTLLCREPVIVEDWRAETRFRRPSLAVDLGFFSGITVLVDGPDRPFGVLGAHTTRRRIFTQDDVHFLQAVAHVLATAIQRKRAEEEHERLLEQLAAERSRLEAVLRQMPAGVIIAEAPSGRHLLYNEQVPQILGRPFQPAADVEHYTQYEGFHPDGQPYHPTEWPLARAIRKGEVVAAEEIDFLRGDGSQGTLRASAAPIRDREGRIVAGVVTLYDVTEQKRAEETLRAQEARLRLLVEQVPAALWTTDRELKFTSGTGLCLTQGQIVGMSLYEFFRTDDPDFPPIAAHRRAMAGESVPYELTREGRTFQAHVEPFFDRQGRVIGCIGVALDITERKRAEETIRFLGEASRQLAASLDYETTLGAVVRLAVPEFADYCHFDLLEEGTIHRVAVAHIDPAKAELISQMRRFPPDPDGPHPIAKALRSGRPQLVAEVTDTWIAAVTDDAEHLAVARALGPRSCICVPLIARDRTLGVLTFATAESGRRYGPADLELAEELARRAALAVDNARLYYEAREAVRVRDDFLARASHELRTPLTIIKGNLAFLARRLRSRGGQTGMLIATAARHVDQMTRLLTGLLDASRLAAGRLPLEPELLELAGVVAEATAQATPLAQAKGVSLVTSVPPGLTLVGDRLKLEQVVLNLLTNAIKHTPRKGTIRAEGQWVAEGQVELRVRDTGEGIAREHLQRIFEPFFQAGSAGGRRRAAEHGAGLGLAIVRRLVDLHGGRVWAESEGPGRGSTFVVRLPGGSLGGRAA